MQFDFFQAEAEGWNIFNWPGPETRLERYDERNLFESDPDAWRWVVGRAREGSTYHQTALLLLPEEERKEIEAAVGWFAEPISGYPCVKRLISKYASKGNGSFEVCFTAPGCGYVLTDGGYWQVGLYKDSWAEGICFEPVPKQPDRLLFAYYEIAPCRRTEDGIGVEQCEKEEAEFWGLYGRDQRSRARHIGDFDSFEAAYEIMQAILIPIRHAIDAENWSALEDICNQSSNEERL